MAEPQPLTTRPLPAKRNTLLLAAATPSYDYLVSIRRLGQTHIATPTNSKPEHCHLPAPLPSDIFASFTSSGTHTYLLRRLSDNYVSATCLFRAVFPYATADEKTREFRHLKNIRKAESDERTGDVWVPAKQAMRLGEEYGVRRWVRALLDPAKAERIPHEVIDLTLDDSGGEEKVEEEDQSEKRVQGDNRRENEKSDAREAEQAQASRSAVRAESPEMQQQHLYGAFMRMAVMR